MATLAPAPDAGLSARAPVPATPPSGAQRTEELERALRDRILVLDGAMGTMIQRYRLDENDFRGERFADHPQPLEGANDLLSLTRPDVIREIHDAHLEAGADIVETNTFNATSTSMADYGLEAAVYDMNLVSARIARAAADAIIARNESRPRFVAGVLGPTNRTASMSPDVNDPAFRNVTFDELAAAYEEQARGLLDGDVDVLMVETVFDTLNAKAALFAIRSLLDRRGLDVPVMVSGTVVDASGRTLSGQTVEAFLNSVRHADPLAVGLNCALGAAALRPHVEELATRGDLLVSCHPNAGLPQRARRVRRDPRVDGRPARRVRARGLPEPRGRVLRHHSRAHRSHRRGRRRNRAAPSAAHRAPHPPLGTRASQPGPRLALRQHRRAHQRHRLRPLPQAHQGRRLRGRAAGGRASRSRTAPSSSTSTWTKGCSIPRRRWCASSP